MTDPSKPNDDVYLALVGRILWACQTAYTDPSNYSALGNFVDAIAGQIEEWAEQHDVPIPYYTRDAETGEMVAVQP